MISLESFVEKSRNKKQCLLNLWTLYAYYVRLFQDRKLSASQQYLLRVNAASFVQALKDPSHTVLCNIFLPPELLYGFGLHPLCLETLSCYCNGAHAESLFLKQAETTGVSSSFCSYHKVVLGLQKEGLLDSFCGIVNTSMPCDANQITFRYLSHTTGIPQFYIEVPLERNSDSVAYVKEQLMALKKSLERQFSFDETVFLKSIENSRKTLQAMLDMQPLRRDYVLSRTLTCLMQEALLFHTGLGTKEALHYTELLQQDYRNGRKRDSSMLTLLWLHTNPYWCRELQELLNYDGRAIVVAQEMGYDSWYRSWKEEDPYTFMAERIVYNAYHTDSRERMHIARKMAEDLNVDGTILFSHWGCRNTCAMEREADKTTLVLHGDGVDRNNLATEQVRTRLEAFLEMIERQKQ